MTAIRQQSGWGVGVGGGSRFSDTVIRQQSGWGVGVGGGGWGVGGGGVGSVTLSSDSSQAGGVWVVGEGVQ